MANATTTMIVRGWMLSVRGILRECATLTPGNVFVVRGKTHRQPPVCFYHIIIYLLRARALRKRYKSFNVRVYSL